MNPYKVADKTSDIYEATFWSEKDGDLFKITVIAESEAQALNRIFCLVEGDVEFVGMRWRE